MLKIRSKRAKIALGVVVGLIALCGFSAAMMGGNDSPATPANAAPVATTAADGSSPAPAAPALTTAQQNAARSAQTYLDLHGFSRSGLIQQLTVGDGYSTADATAAVDSLSVDWMVQAERSAATYLALHGFSRSGLIQQLTVGDGFTPEQAAHGADSVGL